VPSGTLHLYPSFHLHFPTKASEVLGAKQKKRNGMRRERERERRTSTGMSSSGAGYRRCRTEKPGAALRRYMLKIYVWMESDLILLGFPLES
jgi:hypothetical protein